MKCYEIAVLRSNNTWESIVGLVPDDYFGDQVISHAIYEDHKKILDTEVTGYCLLYLGDSGEDQTTLEE